MHISFLNVGRAPVLRRWLLGLLSLLVGIAGLTSPVLGQETLSLRRFTSLDGLPHESITDLAQTPDGRLWVGTRTGLVVYDGYRFETVSLPDSLSRRSILNVEPMADGSVWVALNGRGAVHVRTHRVVRGSPVLALPNIHSLHAQGDTIVATTQEAVWRLVPGANRFQRHPLSYDVKPPAMLWANPASGAGLTDAEVGPEGAFWILDGRLGPGQFQSDGSVAFPPLSTPPDSLWTSMEVLRDGRILLTRAHELVAYDPADGSRRILMQDLNASNYLLRDGRSVYVATADGFRDVALPGYTELSESKAPLERIDDQPTAFLKDRTGTVWMGTQNGLLHFHAPTVRHVRSIQNESIRYVGDFMTGPDKELWVSTYGSGLVQLSPARGRFVPEGFDKWVGLQSTDGRLHAITQGHWYRRRPQQAAGWRQVGPAQGAVRGYVDAGGIGFFWHDNGVFRHDPRMRDAPQPLYRWSPENRGQYAVAQAPGGGLLLRARGALLHVETDGPGYIERDTVARLAPFSDSRGRHMASASTGDVWIVASRRGLIHVNVDDDSSRPHLHLAGEPLYNVSVSGDSLVLGAARSGLFVLDAQTGAKRHHLTGNDGLLNTYVRDAALLEDSLYVSHPNGVTVLPQRTAFRQPAAPATTITGLRVNRESRPVEASLSLAASERTLEIDYAAPYFPNPRRVTYEYRHVPGDTTWQATGRGSQQFSVLEPGHHRFEVRARLGPSTGPPARLEVTVAPLLHETWWFWGLCAVGLGGLLAVGYRWRLAHLRKRKTVLERTVADRTRELRAEKQKTEEQAERLAELDEAKNRLFANLSHEFRTPLTLITEPLRSLLREPDALPAAALRDRLRPMLRNAERLERLIGQLLTLSKSTAGQLELQRHPTDLADLARKCFEAFVPLAERHDVELQFRPGVDTLPAMVDPDKVEKILSNLLSNAVKFTEAGGTIWFTVTRASEAASHARLVVKDTGVGMSETDLRRIFDRFEQVDGSTTRSQEGIGIGLALTRDLVELHDGTIGVESEPNTGSTFTVRLPLGDPPSREAEVPTHAVSGDGAGEFDRSNASGTTSSSTKSSSTNVVGEAPVLLVVDDNADVRSFLRRELGDAYEIETVDTGAEALDRIRASAPDVVVSDVMMPEMDGFALCEAIKTDDDLHTVPILLLTARAEVDDAVEGLECGADDYLTKPFDVRELRMRVRRLLEARATLRSEYEQIVHLDEVDLEVPDAEAAFVEAVLTAVRESIDDPGFTVDCLAEAVALSRRQLTRRLREAVGESPADFIRCFRLERAADRLDASDNPRISDVAYAVGFRTVSHFSKAFRKHFGCSPSQYPDETQG